MTKLSPNIPMLKSHKSPKSSVICGTTLIKLPKTDSKKSTKRTNNLLPRKKPITLQSTERLKRKRKESTKKNDHYLTIYIPPILFNFLLFLVTGSFFASFKASEDGTLSC